MMDAVDQFELKHHGLYPIAFDRRWHCGVHLVPNLLYEPVRAIADGEVVAYRVSQKAISDGQLDAQGEHVPNCNNGFVLLKHATDTGDGRTITFYSLYMHLLDIGTLAQDCPRTTAPPVDSSPTALAKWLETDTGGVQAGQGKKVYRKDILGYMGRNHGYPHLHFEIFMTEEDFNEWFDETQLGKQPLVQPTSSDYWGHTYFVIPGGTTLLATPPKHADSPYFPRQSGGALDANSTLYVEAWFHSGQRYVRAWLDPDGKGKLTLLKPEAIQDPYKEYEYNLYKRATDLYPACPSDGYELMRFGRILSKNPTLPEAARATYVAVPFDAAGTLGYVDVNPSTIVKLSDADFPFFMDWRKIEDVNAPVGQGGLWELDRLRKLVGDETANLYLGNLDGTPFSAGDELTAYVRGDDAVQAQLKGFVCHATSEWDPANNNQRYAGLNEPDGFFGSRADTHPDGYRKFLGHLKKFQFLDQTPLGGGKKLWYFHPLAFIRHFRKCGWLSESEMMSTFPRYPYYQLSSGTYYAIKNSKISTMTKSTAASRVNRYLRELNYSMRKYGLTINRNRQAQFLGQVMLESDRWNTMIEYGEGKYNPRQPATEYYAAFYGRGGMQLTWAGAYHDYGEFKKLPNKTDSTYADPRITSTSTHWFEDPRRKDKKTQKISIIGKPKLWHPRYDPQDIASSPELSFDSAGFFWVGKHHSGARDINRIADLKLNSATIGRISVLVNGGGNGFYDRQAFGLIAAESLGDEILTNTEIRYTPSNRKDSIVIDMESARE
ncbi:hypothetical protein WL70_27395 [Burkholderia ubonensis]|nr:hypothetical protein WL70_27395 [Burkholderia ubonensis]KWE02520.1 hypothetical protein WL72_05730 [Burkholderia ubonensis]